MKIFGREPALWIGVIGAILTFVAGMNLPGLSTGQATALTAFVAGVIIALTTRPWAPGLFTGVVAAGAALLTEYGMNVADTTVAAASALVVALFALVSRGQVSPAEKQLDDRPRATASDLY